MFPNILLICYQPIFRASATDAVVSERSNHEHYRGLSLCFRTSCGLGFISSSTLPDFWQGSVKELQSLSSGRDKAFRSHTTASKWPFCRWMGLLHPCGTAAGSWCSETAPADGEGSGQGAKWFRILN